MSVNTFVVPFSPRDAPLENIGRMSGLPHEKVYRDWLKKVSEKNITRTSIFDTCGLYYKSFMIVIYDCNDSMIIIILTVASTVKLKIMILES
jgi:hypothetical protein